MASIAEKVFKNHDCAVAQVMAWKDAGKKIVFTNGCFDLIDIGHVLYLEEAKSLGDILIVAANSHASVSKLKGPHRPIKDEYNRTHILAALASVDMVLVFEENDRLRGRPDLARPVVPVDRLGSAIAPRSRAVRRITASSSSRIGSAN